MVDEIQFDKNLWFEHLGCEGKHYLLGNPHTHKGRMFAWCPHKQRTFFVSKSEFGESSEQTKYWIKGFLSGNSPEPPINHEGEVNFESTEYIKWVKAIELFTETGYWWTGEERPCKSCKKVLLESEPNDICRECKK